MTPGTLRAISPAVGPAEACGFPPFSNGSSGVVAYSIGMIQTIFALTVAAAGWYYMFYSQAASRLAGVESETVNRRRVRLRRLNGLMMFLLGIFFFAGFFAVDLDRPTVAFF